MSHVNPRYIHTTFCDDVRTELGGKISLMGIYQGNMTVESTSLPVSIPKMCIVVEAKAPLANRFQKMYIKVFMDESLLVEGEIPPEQLILPPPDESAKYAMHGIIFAIQPFLVEKDGALRVRVETEEGEVTAGGLKVSCSLPANVNASS